MVDDAVINIEHPELNKLIDDLFAALDKNEQEDAEKLVYDIIQKKEMEREQNPFEMKNEKGDTPLHVAASKGFAKLCKLMVDEGRESLNLVKKKNNKGETPLLLAALSWNRNKYTFVYFSEKLKEKVITLDDIVRDEDGDSILHCAIKHQHFDLAIMILHYYESLCLHTNKKGITPLKALAEFPLAFRSGTDIFGWKLILYHCILVGRLDPESEKESILNEAYESDWKFGKGTDKKPDDRFPLNYRTLMSFFVFFLRWVLTYIDGLSPLGLLMKNSEDSSTYFRGLLPPNYNTFRQFVHALVGGFVGFFGLGEFGYDTLRMKKNKHKWSRQLLKELMKRPHAALYGIGGRPKQFDQEMYYEGIKVYDPQNNRVLVVGHGETIRSSKVDEESIFVRAVGNGIVEMVREILDEIPDAIYERSTNGDDVMAVAVKNRQADVIQAMIELEKKEILDNFIIGAFDDGKDNILHLAARGLTEDQPGEMAGFALQMMWDIKWFEYIKSLVPQHYELLRTKEKKKKEEEQEKEEEQKKKEEEQEKKKGKTAGEIFREEHRTIIEKSSEWLKDTSESCSVVAALIAGVSFATAYTIPGGNNDNGDSPFRHKSEFKSFAISSLIGLSFSVTALTMFLSILTSRKEARDFRKSLPRKLLFGLSSLFVSITAMFVSFCSGHYFLINEEYKGILFPLYAATALPVIFFAVAQFPLYYDLIVTTLYKVPIKSKGVGGVI